MRRSLILLLTVPVFSVCLAFLSMKGAADIYMTQSGSVSFVSNAQLEKIEASNQKMEALLNRTDKTVSFQVPISAFTGFNSDLQHEHFNKNYMEIEKYAKATFVGKIIEDVDLSNDGQYNVRDKGMLDIHDVSVERVVSGIVKIKSESIEIVADFEVPLKDHGIKTPRIVNQKIAESVGVTVEVQLTPKVF